VSSLSVFLANAISFFGTLDQRGGVQSLKILLKTIVHVLPPGCDLLIQ
jgi:hypothetical protein